jgi:hypothetical protein
MVDGRHGNTRLAALINEAGVSHAQLARAFVRVALENGAREFVNVGRSHVSHWVAGSRPSGRAPQFLAEALSRQLGRMITLDEIGLAVGSSSPHGVAYWRVDAMVELADLGRVDVDQDRRRILEAAAYSVAVFALPPAAWWHDMAAGRRPSIGTSRVVGTADVEAVQEMIMIFSRLDQRRGGGHARTAVVQYLASDVAGYLRGTFTDDSQRRAMFTAAGELAYLSGWMAFDSGEHAIAQRHFTLAVKLAAEADDAPLAGHILRAMAHQALDLGHSKLALDLASASVDGSRYTAASPRERALLCVVHARTLAANGDRRAAATALVNAETDLAAACDATDEPSRVFFFGEASLAHETACTLRDVGDLRGAVREFHRSVRTRKAALFARTHAVTLGYLGAVHARQGELDEACATWSTALDAMEGVRSGRTRQVALDIRATLAPVQRRLGRRFADIDQRAASYLASLS